MNSIRLEQLILRVFAILLFTLLPRVIFAQVVIERCDVTTGWHGAQSILVDNTDKKEGSASLKTEAKTGNSIWYSKSFSDTYTGISNTGYLSFWLYVSDASKLEGGQVEISSSGASDKNRYIWLLNKENIADGWNNIQLQISSDSKTDGGAS